MSEEKSELQKVIDLLEANGYHVIKAEREPPTDFSFLFSRAFGTISLQIAPKDEKNVS